MTKQTSASENSKGLVESEEDIGKQRATSGKQVRKPRRAMSEKTGGQNHAAESENSTDEIRKHDRIGKQESKNNTKKSENWRKNIQKMGVVTPLFCKKPGGEGSPRSFHGQKPRGAVLSRLGFGHTPSRQGRPRSVHPSVLPTNRKVKEGRAPFTPRFWRQTEW